MMNSRRSRLAASARAPPKRRQQPSPEKTKVCRLGSASLAPTPSPKPPPIADPSWGGGKGNVGRGCAVPFRPIFEGDAAVADPDAFRPPQLVNLLIEGDEVDAAL